MKTIALVSFLVVFMCLTACAPVENTAGDDEVLEALLNPVYETAEEVSAATTVSRDDYAKQTWIKGPLVRYSPPRNRCFLRTLITDDGRRIDQLYVAYSPHDWAFLDHAYDRSGRRLDVTVIDHDVSRYATISEDVGVRLDDAYLRQAAVDGIDIKVSGRLGSTTVQLPPHYVNGYLDRLDEALAEGVPSP